MTGLLPGRAAEIERQSREWLLICPGCGHERDYWEVGGVRYKAKSIGKRVRLTCPACRTRAWQRVERRSAGVKPPAEDEDRWGSGRWGVE